MAFTKSIANMIAKERLDALFTQVGWSVVASAGADGGITQLKPAIFGLKPAVPISSLQVADDHLAS